MKKSTLSLLLIIMPVAIHAMDKPKRVREIIKLNYEANARQADSFLEDYCRGNVQLNSDNSVTFSDMEDDALVYTTSHSEVLGIMKHLSSRQDEILTKNATFTLEWAKNPQSEYSHEFKRIIMAFRLIMMHENLDLSVLTSLGDENTARNIMQNRTQYKKAFEILDKAAFDVAKTKPINSRAIPPFKQYIKEFQELVRTGQLRIHGMR